MDKRKVLEDFLYNKNSVNIDDIKQFGENEFTVRFKKIEKEELHELKKGVAFTKDKVTYNIRINQNTDTQPFRAKVTEI